MAETKPLRWGILGCARITKRGLIPGIRASETGTLAALASRDLPRAQEWAREFEIPRTHGSYESLLADPEIDAVYIPLPNELHRPWAFAAADAGKHILCEKPLALDASEAEEIVAHCRSRGVLLMEAFMWRHQPRVAELRRLIRDEKAIGELRLIRSAFSFAIEPGDWRLDPKRGGGALWDVGCYGVSASRLFASADPEQISAMAHFEGGVDLTLTAQLRFPGDVLALVDCSFEQPFRCALELVGTRGSIEIADAFLPAEHPTARLILDGKEPQVLSFDGKNQYGAMVDAFARSIAAGKLIDPAEDGLAQMKALDAILKQARGR